MQQTGSGQLRCRKRVKAEVKNGTVHRSKREVFGGTADKPAITQMNSKRRQEEQQEPKQGHVRNFTDTGITAEDKQARKEDAGNKKTTADKGRTVRDNLGLNRVGYSTIIGKEKERQKNIQEKGQHR